jgi:hypothetical protein
MVLCRVSTHLHGVKNGGAVAGIEQSFACYPPHAGFMLVLFFDREGGDDVCLRNVGWISVYCTTLYPRRQNSSWTAPLLLKVYNPCNEKPFNVHKFIVNNPVIYMALYNSLHVVQTISGASYPVDTGDSFPAVRAAGAWSWPLISN